MVAKAPGPMHNASRVRPADHRGRCMCPTLPRRAGAVPRRAFSVTDRTPEPPDPCWQGSFVSPHHPSHEGRDPHDHQDTTTPRSEPTIDPRSSRPGSATRPHDRRRPAADGLQRLARRGRGPRRPHPGRRRVSGRLARRPGRPEIERAADAKAIVAGDARSSSTARDRRRTAARRGGSLASASTTPASWTTASAAWAADPTCRSISSPRHDRLVHIEWLGQVLAGGRPEAAPDGKFLLFHVNFGVPEEYEEGHIPGALYLDTNWLENPVDWNRRTPGGARGRRPRARDHQRHDGRRSTAATPSARRTRSGPAGGPARSPRRGR